MKQVLLLFTCIALISFTGKPAENKVPLPTIPIAGVYLYSNGITSGAGNVAEGHPDEVRLAYDSGNATLPVTIGGGGGTQIGIPNIGPITIKKGFDVTSLRLSRLLVNPTQKTFEVRYYNGVSADPVYKIVLINSYITSAERVSVDCQGSGCIGIKEVYSITPIITEYHNLMVSPAQILTYNRATGNSTWTNN
jgi:hypothetical protein